LKPKGGEGWNKVVKWDTDIYNLQSMDTDNTGNVIAFFVNVVYGLKTVKVIVLNNGITNNVLVKYYTDLHVSITVDISKHGQVVAVLASKVDEDGNFFRTDDPIEALAIIPRKIVVAAGRWLEREEKVKILGVPRCLVFHSHDGTTGAVTSNSGIALHGICLILIPSTLQLFKQKLLQTKQTSQVLDLPLALLIRILLQAPMLVI
jgi:hypothetical protein